ncbi:Glycosyl transferase family 2 [Acididesulfobacillus acetoxydans]|uniref:Bactoprenol glucosyl transferase n=1 Tax=Acididesulfobacillus acetoxydans TaxID=1561005 RepID=A0A8S0W8Q2_9FIRM|nr:glycosyltransferase family 2 protein [Acididesulfobacillus acetoxydans]CAA7601979.1 Glycosyl transferase family 2 [Acididesulfobacillus acetoxydans]CEJ08177.1 Bactoprenol glucosyl transferase [Acididesulfobacillus acetoxydans]
MDRRPVELSVVVPLYNEEQVLPETYKRLKQVLDSTREPYEIIFVDDGSRDRTLDLAREFCQTDENIKLLSFSRNFGHQIAITAGMDHSCGSAVVVIDADLQDPPEVIPAMIEKWRQGFDVVYGRRAERKGETFFKKLTAKLFYKLLHGLSEVDVPLDAGDFRLLDRKACDALKSLPERNRYVRGLASWIGFKQTGIEFVREERFAGETKYPLRKMLKLAADGITSFSYKPLKLAGYLGTVMILASGLYLLYALGARLFAGFAAPGWDWLAAVGLFGNGVTLAAIAILGEYIGRIADEAKARPLYILKEKMGYDVHAKLRARTR